MVVTFGGEDNDHDKKKKAVNDTMTESNEPLPPDQPSELPYPPIPAPPSLPSIESVAHGTSPPSPPHSQTNCSLLQSETRCVVVRVTNHKVDHENEEQSWNLGEGKGDKLVVVAFQHTEAKVTWEVVRKMHQIGALHEQLQRELPNANLPPPLEGEGASHTSARRHSQFTAQASKFKKGYSFDEDFLERCHRYLVNLANIPDVLETEAFGVFAEVSARSFVGYDGRPLKVKLMEGYTFSRCHFSNLQSNVLAKSKGPMTRTIHAIYNAIVLRGFLQPKERFWICLRKGSLHYSKSRTDPEIVEDFLFDPYFSIDMGLTRTGFRHGLVLRNAHKTLVLQFDSHLEVCTWRQAIVAAFESSEFRSFDLNSHDSFAPPRQNSQVEMIIDGENHFKAVLKALQGAEREILISDWWLTPDLPLTRPLDPKTVLCEVLSTKAKEGVQVFINMYREFENLLVHKTRWVAELLEGKHPNIHVVRHPSHLGKRAMESMYWSHHQKICIVDAAVAFVGGIDLCLGRFDSQDHPMTDAPDDVANQLFPGMDYHNPSTGDCVTDVEQAWVRDVMNRKKDPRMPRHDVSCCLRGEPARDVRRHFRMLWHHITSDLKVVYSEKEQATRLDKAATASLDTADTKTSKADVAPMTFKRMQSFNPNSKKKDWGPGYIPSVHASQRESIWEVADFSPEQEVNAKTQLHSAQVLRSCGWWSCGMTKPEKSIYVAMKDTIEQAEEFVYIENQFFVTSSEQEDTEAQQLVMKLAEMKVDETFFGTIDADMMLSEQFFDAWWKPTSLWVARTGVLSIFVLGFLTFADFSRNRAIFAFRAGGRWTVVILFVIFMIGSRKIEKKSKCRKILLLLLILWYTVILITNSEHIALLTKGDATMDGVVSSACWSPISFLIPQLVWVVAVLRMPFFDVLLMLIWITTFHFAVSAIIGVQLFDNWSGVIRELGCVGVAFAAIAYGSYRDDRQTRYLFEHENIRDAKIVRKPSENLRNLYTTRHGKGSIFTSLVSSVLMDHERNLLSLALRDSSLKLKVGTITYSDPNVEFAFRRGQWHSVQKWAKITIVFIVVYFLFMTINDFVDGELPSTAQHWRLVCRGLVLITLLLYILATKGRRTTVKFKRHALSLVILIFCVVFVLSEPERLGVLSGQIFRTKHCYSDLSILTAQIAWVCIFFHLPLRNVSILLITVFCLYVFSGMMVKARDIEDAQLFSVSMSCMVLMSITFVILARRTELLTRLLFLLELDAEVGGGIEGMNILDSVDSDFSAAQSVGSTSSAGSSASFNNAGSLGVKSIGARSLLFHGASSDSTSKRWFWQQAKIAPADSKRDGDEIDETINEVNFCQNTIARSIIDRCVRALREGKRFRVYVMIPLAPADPAMNLDTPEAFATRMQILVNLTSISRGPMSLLATLERELQKAEKYAQQNGVTLPYQVKSNSKVECVAGSQSSMNRFPRASYFIHFTSLRTTQQMPDGHVATEQIYIHSKVLIADDNVAIIGSANINDRSLLGDRDCEVACIIKDVPDSHNKQQSGPSFAKALRMALWEEHFGALGCRSRPQSQQPQSNIRSRSPRPSPRQDEDESLQEREATNPIEKEPGKLEGGFGARLDTPNKGSRYTKVQSKDNGEFDDGLEVLKWILQDPQNDECWKHWTTTAAENSAWYRQAFHAWPDNTIKTYASLATAQAPQKARRTERQPELARNTTSPAVEKAFADTAESVKEEVGAPNSTTSSVICGPDSRLCDYPIDFLEDEDIMMPTPKLVPPIKIFA